MRNSQPFVALGQAVEAIDNAARELNRPSSVIATFQGNAQAFQTSLASEPALIAAALVVVYIDQACALGRVPARDAGCSLVILCD